MAGVLSRPAAVGAGVFENVKRPVDVVLPCYVLSHAWSTSCLSANRQVLAHLLFKCLNIYSVLYLASGLIRWKGLQYWTGRYPRDVLRSAMMLVTNGILIFSGNCFTRQVTGRFRPASLRLVVFIASLVAIFWERPQRRSLLTVYMGSNALECFVNRLIEYNHIKHRRCFEVPLFMLGSGIFGYYHKKECSNALEGLKEPLRVILGFWEEAQPVVDRMDIFQRFKRTIPLHNEVSCFFDHFRCPKTRHCLHDMSCVQYTCYGLCRGLTVGFALSSAFSLLRRLTKLTSVRRVLACVASFENVRVACFLSLFVAVFRGVSCSLRSLLDRNDDVIGAISGATAGVAFVLIRNYVLALYVSLKALEVWSTESSRGTWVERVPLKTELLYALSVTETIFGVVLYPQNVRPEYRAFIQNAADWKLSQYNRQLAAAHWALRFQNVPHYPAFDPAMQPVYEYWADLQRNHTP